MNSFTQTLIIGFVAQQPKAFTLPSGQRSLQFIIPTNRRWKDPATGAIQERTEWHLCRLGGPQAAMAESYLQAKKYVLVLGENATYEYKDGDGKTRHKHFVEVHQLFYLAAPKVDVGPPPASPEGEPPVE